MIRIVWIVNEPFLNNFITVYNEIQKDDRFALTVVAAPRAGFAHCDANSTAQISAYLTRNGVEHVDCETDGGGRYLDLRELRPDYVFRST